MYTSSSEKVEEEVVEKVILVRVCDTILINVARFFFSSFYFYVLFFAAVAPEGRDTRAHREPLPDYDLSRA